MPDAPTLAAPRPAPNVGEGVGDAWRSQGRLDPGIGPSGPARAVVPEAATPIGPTSPSFEGDWGGRERAFAAAQEVARRNIMRLSGLSDIPARGKQSEALAAVRMNRETRDQVDKELGDYYAREIEMAKARFEQAKAEKDEAKKRDALEDLKRIAIAENEDNDLLPDVARKALMDPETLLSEGVYSGYINDAQARRKARSERAELRQRAAVTAAARLGRDPSPDEAATISRLIDNGADEKGLNDFFDRLEAKSKEALSLAAAEAEARHLGVPYSAGMTLVDVSRAHSARVAEERLGVSKATLQHAILRANGAAASGNLREMRNAVRDAERVVADLNEKWAFAEEDKGGGYTSTDLGEGIVDVAPSDPKVLQAIEEAEAKVEMLRSRLRAIQAHYRSMPPEERAARNILDEDLIEDDPAIGLFTGGR